MFSESDLVLISIALGFFVGLITHAVDLVYLHYLESIPRAQILAGFLILGLLSGVNTADEI